MFFQRVVPSGQVGHIGCLRHGSYRVFVDVLGYSFQKCYNCFPIPDLQKVIQQSFKLYDSRHVMFSYVDNQIDLPVRLR